MPRGSGWRPRRTTAAPERGPPHRRVSRGRAGRDSLAGKADRIFSAAPARRCSRSPRRKGRQFVGVSDRSGADLGHDPVRTRCGESRHRAIGRSLRGRRSRASRELLVLTTTERARGKGAEQPHWLWRGKADRLEWKRERVVLEFPSGGPTIRTPISVIPWLLHEGRESVVALFLPRTVEGGFGDLGDAVGDLTLPKFRMTAMDLSNSLPA